MNAGLTFCSRTLTISIKEDSQLYEAECTYNVLHCEQSYYLVFRFPNPFTAIQDVMDFFYQVLWDYSPCIECYHLTPKSNPLCVACIPSRIMYLWGKTKNRIASLPLCAICFDPVFHSRLHCGHSMHKMCVNRLNPHSWYDYQLELRCPLCREALNDQDKYEYFLYES